MLSIIICNLIIQPTKKNNLWKIITLIRNQTAAKKPKYSEVCLEKIENQSTQLECQRLNWQPKILINMPPNAVELASSLFHSQHTVR